MGALKEQCTVADTVGDDSWQGSHGRESGFSSVGRMRVVLLCHWKSDASRLKVVEFGLFSNAWRNLRKDVLSSALVKMSAIWFFV